MSIRDTSSKEKCPFCEQFQESFVDANSYAFVIRDTFPVTKLHTLVIPRRHIASYFDLYEYEVIALHELLTSQQSAIRAVDPSVTGFNIGINCGADSGQTIFHCHIHLIPRRKGDVTNPSGGIRHIFPGKGDYLSTRSD